MSGNWHEVPHAAWSRSAIMYNADARVRVRGRQKSQHSGLCKGDFHLDSWSRGLIGTRISAFLPPCFYVIFKLSEAGSRRTDTLMQEWQKYSNNIFLRFENHSGKSYLTEKALSQVVSHQESQYSWYFYVWPNIDEVWVCRTSRVWSGAWLSGIVVFEPWIILNR